MDNSPINKDAMKLGYTEMGFINLSIVNEYHLLECESYQTKEEKLIGARKRSNPNNIIN